MNFVISVIHAVADPVSAATFLCDALGFKNTCQSSDAVIVENGAIAVRLVPDETLKPAGCLNLELQTRNMAQATSELLARSDVSLIASPVAVNPARVESLLQGPQGIQITLAQEFDEDELGIIPLLPVSLHWDEQAEDCIRQILRLIPVGFRDSARMRITERAEMLAAEDAEITVAINYAVQALADVTPLFQHPVLISALQQRGIDPSGYFNKRTAS